ncbi:hypothetical protein M595_2170 [Lyngbya aestuarii BL J]|uniref:Uncharacterized protein n=1 Tax=Lyngbya aestuarii BL J TaxID=1348334 RepID=U7QL43_9CYAN|nr:hypothetical protein [Lyngbya aestuarii]ERT07830.1 hypothetical protein M595_2170 [Lyngbya aestuarii BL J]
MLPCSLGKFSRDRRLNRLFSTRTCQSETKILNRQFLDVPISDTLKDGNYLDVKLSEKSDEAI